MKIHRACWVVATALITTGCGPEGPGFIEAPPRITMVGSADDSSTDGDTTKRDVPSGKAVETKGVMAFHVFKPNDYAPWEQNYRVIFGTSEGENQSAIGKFLVKPHPSTPARSMAWFRLTGNCWVYVYGQGPIVETGRVSAGSDGSKLLIQIDTVADVHRVYYFEGAEPAHVRTKAAIILLTENMFVEADRNGILTVPVPIPLADHNGTPIQKFRHYFNCQKQPFEK